MKGVVMRMLAALLRLFKEPKIYLTAPGFDQEEKWVWKAFRAKFTVAIWCGGERVQLECAGWSISICHYRTPASHPPFFPHLWDIIDNRWNWERCCAVHSVFGHISFCLWRP